VIATIGSLGASLGSCLLSPEGSRPFGAGCGVVAWIRDSSNPGALASAWDRFFCFPRARAPVGPDAAWFHGFVLAVISGPMLLIDSAARLIEISDSSNFRALNPAWDWLSFPVGSPA